MEVTHARVKFKDDYDNLITFVKITDVKEFQLQLPKHKNGFEKNKYYSVKWTDEKNPNGLYLPAQICELASGDNEVKELSRKRGKFTKLSDTILADFLNDECDSGENENDEFEKQKVIDDKAARKTLKKKIQRKQKENEETILKEKLSTLTSVGLTYTNTDNSRKDDLEHDDVNVNDEKQHNDASVEIDVKKVSTEISDAISIHTKKLEEKLSNCENIIIKQDSIIKKLKYDLEKSNDKNIFLENMNNKILKNMHRSPVKNLHISPVKSMNISPVKRNLFPNVSTPVKQKSHLDFEKSLSQIENVCSPMKGIDNTYMQETLNEFYGSDEILSAAGTSKQTYNTFKDPKPLGKRKSTYQLEDQLSPKKDGQKRLKPDNLEKIIDENFEIKRNKEKKQKKTKANKKIKRQKKKKSNKKKKKKADSEDDYDSDQYSDRTTLPHVESWYKEEGGQKIKMMHLFFGISITYEAWKDIRSTPKPSLYLRKLAKAIWGSHALVNRAIDLSKTHRRLIDRSPRKCLTPIKKAVLRKMFYAFVEKEVAAKNKKTVKNSWKKYLGDYINYLYKTICKTKSSDDDSSTTNNGSDSSDESSESSSSSE